MSLCDADGNGTRRAVNEGGVPRGGSESQSAPLSLQEQAQSEETWDLPLNTDRPGGEPPAPLPPREALF